MLEILRYRQGADNTPKNVMRRVFRKELAEVQRKARADNLPFYRRVATRLNEVSYYKQGCEYPKSVPRQYISQVNKSVFLGLTLLKTEPNPASTLSLRL